MRIAHIVTYVSVDGAFGGPLAVARAQAEELARRGHDVDLLAGWDGEADFSVPGVNVGLFPTRRIAPGFSGLIAPGLIRHLRSLGRQYDVVHVHFARDLITATAAQLAQRSGRRVVLQPHGMVMPDRRVRARLFDAALVRKVLRRAQRILTLTSAESIGLDKVAGADLQLHRITNGLRPPAAFVREESAERPIVLFLARLHPRKRVLVFAEAARQLSRSGSRAIFRVVGPDEGDLDALQAFITEHGLDGRLVYAGSVGPGGSFDELRRASIFVLPSHGEVFPMTVLEAMSVGTPVIVSRDCGIASELETRHAAVIVDGAAPELAEAIDTLLSDAQRRDAVARHATDAFHDWLSIEIVAEQLEEHYR